MMKYAKIGLLSCCLILAKNTPQNSTKTARNAKKPDRKLASHTKTESKLIDIEETLHHEVDVDKTMMVEEKHDMWD